MRSETGIFSGYLCFFAALKIHTDQPGVAFGEKEDIKVKIFLLFASIFFNTFQYVRRACYAELRDDGNVRIYEPIADLSVNFASTM